MTPSAPRVLHHDLRVSNCIHWFPSQKNKGTIYSRHLFLLLCSVYFSPTTVTTYLIFLWEPGWVWAAPHRRHVQANKLLPGPQRCVGSVQVTWACPCRGPVWGQEWKQEVGRKGVSRDNGKGSGSERKRTGGKSTEIKEKDQDGEKKGQGNIQLPHTKPGLTIHAFLILLQQHRHGT